MRIFTLLFFVAGLFNACTAVAQTTRYVDANLATGANDGSSWANAYRGAIALRAALGEAEPGDEVWVAAGRYIPSASNRRSSFPLITGVGVYGGFAGNETLREQRDPAVNITILSGDLAGDDGPNFVNRAENSMRVVVAVNAQASAVLDGFTVSGGSGYVDELGITGPAAGLYISGGQGPTVRRCIFTDNRSTPGVALACVGGTASVLPGGDGAGAFITGGASVRFEDCEFRGNRCGDAPAAPTCTSGSPGGHGGRGGAIAVIDASVELVRCLLENNAAGSGGSGGAASTPQPGGMGGAGGSGGALYVENGGALSIIQCRFFGNAAGSGGPGGSGAGVGGTAGSGGAIACVLAEEVDIVESRFEQDSAGNGGAGGALSPLSALQAGTGAVGGIGGALYFSGVSGFSMVNSLVAGNTAGAGGPGGSAGVFGTGGTGGTGGDGGGIGLDLDVEVVPNFVNCTVVSNAAGAAGPGGAAGTAGVPGGWGNGGGVARNGIPATFINAIVYYNQAGNGSTSFGTGQLFTSDSATATLTNVCIQGVLDFPPQLIAAAPNLGPDFVPLPGSPCIDAGTNAPAPVAALTVDLAGNPRFVDVPAAPNTGTGPGPIIDIGAFEVQAPPTCAADFNGVDGVTVQDIYDFLAAWNSGLPSADFNGVGGVTVQDIYDFLAAWNAGCG